MWRACLVLLDYLQLHTSLYLGMPRRRASKGRQGTSSAARSRGKKDSSIQRWKSREDIPLDEVDQCEFLNDFRLFLKYSLTAVSQSMSNGIASFLKETK